MTQRQAAVRIGLRRALIVFVHLGLWTAAYFLAFGLRFDFDANHVYVHTMLRWFPILLGTRFAISWFAGSFRGMWRYTGTRDLKTLLLTTTASSVVFFALLGLLFQTLPRSVLIIEWALCIILVGGARFAYRAWSANRGQVPRPDVKPARLLIVGAGDAAELLLREVLRNHTGRYRVVGLVDDKPQKVGEHIHGVKVLGSVEQLPHLVVSHEIEEVVIAVPSATGPQMRRLVERCQASGARFRTIPGLDQLIDGRVTLSQIRDVDIEDLLGRDPVRLDMAAISEAMRNQVVMVTGAGGSIGSELCRQVCRFGPSVLLLVERSENSLFQVHRELAARHPELPVVPCLADIGDRARLEELFEAHRPTVVLHAAAHKHVPMMEWNPGEAVKNNVFGTRLLADLANAQGVRRFVMISTDKAVNPTSVMGVTKRVAEMYVQALSQRSHTRFVTVRFGNVLGSAGSVIPIFKEQIAAGGPVTVTHPEMNRYFMTIPEASSLVLQAGVMGRGGEIFILDMGQPVRITDLARELISLSGLKPGVDIEIAYTGIRPGEKLFEELSVDDEAAEKTGHPKIFVGRIRQGSSEALQAQLARLEAALAGPPAGLRDRLQEMVPEYHPSDDVRDLGGLDHPEAVSGVASRAAQPAMTPAPLPLQR